MIWLEHLLSILFSGGILALAMLLRRLTGTWATPAGLFCGFWFLFSFIPLLALYFVPVNPLAIGYILLCCLSFSLPAFGVDWRSALRRNAALASLRSRYLDSLLIRVVFLASFFMSTLFILIDLLVQGITPAEMIFNFFESSNSYLEKRYEGVIETNPFGQWGLIAAYLCVIFGGLIHATMKSSWRRPLVLLMVMMPPILVMLVQAAKGLFFISIAIVLGGHLIQRVLANKQPHVDFRALARQGKYLVIAAPLILLSLLARGLYNLDADELEQRLLAYLASYAFLHIYAFSDWFSFMVGQPALQSYPNEPLTFGYYTFIALFKLLGSTKIVPPGVYGEYFSFGDLSPGNIYTIYRGLLTDFGLPGSLLAMYLLGSIFNAAFLLLVTTRYPAVSIAVVFLFVQMLYTSYIISALIWNTTYLVTVLCALIMIANKYYVRAHAHRRRCPRKTLDLPSPFPLSANGGSDPA